ncbi:probable helicase with zinc finger domain isoform X3 [Halichondria panicea]|uniref:probable helicase with zinc finger domain isoform X3 n=1 Tax=Halichondria panicea TaxID=6063 RepID=UPI00312B469B
MARRSRQVPFYGWVCKDCLEVNPWNTDLLTTECSFPQAHLTEELVCVAISDDLMLEPIRSLPKKIPPWNKFSLCQNADGSCRHRNRCTYAHSKAEQKAWNAQLEDDRKSKAIRPMPKKIPPWKRFSLCKKADGSCCRRGWCTYAHSKAEQDSWNAQLAESEDDSITEEFSDDLMVEPIRPMPNRLPPGEKSEDDSKSEEFSDDWMFEPIRPMPNKLPPGKKFSICKNADGSCCHGDNCTYAHSKAEQDSWNAQLAESEDDSISEEFSHDWVFEPIRPMPNRLPPGKKFSICKNADGSCRHGDNCTYAHSKAEQDSWNAQLAESEDDSISEDSEAMRPRRQASPLRHQIGSQQQVPPLTAQWGRGYRSLSVSHSESSVDYQQDRRVSTPKFAYPDSQSQMSPSPNSKCVQPDPRSPSSGDVVHPPLSAENYKIKFTELLKLDKIERKRVLDEKCNGEYDLFLYQNEFKPSALRRPPDDRYCRYGYLKAISEDQVAYATQASQGSICILNRGQVNICKAHILRDDYSHTAEKLYMYIGLEPQEEQKLQLGLPETGSKDLTRILVKFELNQSYFKHLKSCVSKTVIPMIQKILPTPRLFSQEPIDIRIDLKPFESLCSPDQFAALESILTCSPRGPPNIIVGPFGSGKTRLLAMAASCFFAEARIKQQPARILVCTQQRESVDNFYDHYQNLMTGKEDDVEVIILRDHDFKHSVYKTIKSFLLYRQFLDMQQNHLVMSTCMMVRPKLVKDIGDRFFTHILIDEGAQMREPEAIAPLSLAHPDTTKIVIAGDQQVGPAMLVFGEVPSSYSLATSLLERLHSSYKRLRQEFYISTLVTNYRSHPDIFELPSSLFYDTPLISPSDRDPPSLHPLYPYPLVFVCSSIDQVVTQVDDNVNEAEASILLDEVNKFAIAKSWPTASWGPQDKVMSQTCIMSPSRPQLTMINNLIRKKTLSDKLKTLQRLPTYDMQGREFRALFLSTSEPTHSDASSRNPTKSLCDPHIFNTAVTRAQSLVVAIGNPFLLLKTEQTKLEEYETKGEVWSNYLKRCLDHDSFIIPSSLNLTKKKTKAIRLLLEDELDDDEASLDSTSNESTSMIDEGDFPLQPLPPQDDLLQHSLPSTTVQNSSGTSAMAASSRWNEYEKKDQIGKGGFGVVFHVKHKVDQADYALKIIKLSDVPKKQDKVVKEVTTLAMLNHPNIVRYYNSWKERAPDGWTEEELWSMLKSSNSLPTALIPVTTTMGSTSTTSSSTHIITSTPTDTHVVSSDLSQGAFGLTCRTADSVVVSFCNDADSLPVHSQAPQPLLTETIDSNAECPKIQPSLPLNPPTCLFIQTELCERDTLRTWLGKNCEEKSRTRSQVLSFFKQILEALVYIHQKSIVHRDLKPSNIFFSRGEKDRLKIGDFGLARTVAMPPGAPTGVDTINYHGSANSYSKGSMQAGTFLYMSPEQVKGEKYDEKSDMFALGIILFELHYFMEARNQVLTALRKLEFPPKFEENHLSVTRMVKLLLATNPAERPTADELLSTNSSLRKLSKKVRKAKDDYIL